MHDKAVKIYYENLKAADDNNMGITERVLHSILVGQQYYYLGETDSAWIYFKKAMAYPDVDQNVRALKYRPLNYLGDLHYFTGNIDSAIFYKLKAFEWYDKNGFLYLAMFVSNQLGAIYFNKNEIKTAILFYNHAERLFEESIIKNAWYRHDSLKYVVSYGTNLYGPIVPKHIREAYLLQFQIILYRAYFLC